ncbi:hypothetical protein DU478_17515 [Thalassococcus profundi]|uniref:Uncharacterized protein n=1 Tax=Thalassococcus profundi TaxID=2282382 RepID=A0A369TID4_9RHOB|nr:DUF6527 family protein [Thalassococcus profundi]RDD65000.1 hypothetical protein DU478_17515 [Thalassococcus profundi]
MIRAVHFSDIRDFREKRMAGSVHFTAPGDQGEGHLWFFCPCGCGLQQRILVGNGFKPAAIVSSWCWDGKSDSATLTPSVNIEGHWHGWLRGGYWESC